jgi:hypothetical protein
MSHSKDRESFPALGECEKRSMQVAGKMFRYRQQDCLSLIMEYSDRKLKQKGLFTMRGPRPKTEGLDNSPTNRKPDL